MEAILILMAVLFLFVVLPTVVVGSVVSVKNSDKHFKKDRDCVVKNAIIDKSNNKGKENER